MPAPPATPSGVVRSIMNFAPSTDADVRSRFDLSYTGGPPSSAGLAAIAQEVMTAFSAQLKSQLTSADACEFVECIDLANPSTPSGTYAVPVAGTRTGTQVPLSITALINFEPDRRYRGSKPKIFLPFGTDTDVNNPDTWSSTFTGGLDSAWGGFLGEFAGTSVGGVTLGGQVCVSYFSGKHANPNPNGRLQFLPTQRATPLVVGIVSHATAVRYGSQRRRIRA